MEKIWINSDGNKRKALQGLIRATGMKIHAENGNIKAAVKMGRKSQDDLQIYGGTLKSPKVIEFILAEVIQNLANLDKNSHGQ